MYLVEEEERNAVSSMVRRELKDFRDRLKEGRLHPYTPPALRRFPMAEI